MPKKRIRNNLSLKPRSSLIKSHNSLSRHSKISGRVPCERNPSSLEPQSKNFPTIP